MIFVLSLHQSLVLISKLPYVTFFHSLLKIMAPEYFEKLEPCLEAGQSEGVSLCISVSRTDCLSLPVAPVILLLLMYSFTACNDIDRWPTPHPGRILTLPIMGVVIKVHTFTHKRVCCQMSPCRASVFFESPSI